MRTTKRDELKILIVRVRAHASAFVLSQTSNFLPNWMVWAISHLPWNRTTKQLPSKTWMLISNNCFHYLLLHIDIYYESLYFTIHYRCLSNLQIFIENSRLIMIWSLRILKKNQTHTSSACWKSHYNLLQSLCYMMMFHLFERPNPQLCQSYEIPN